MNPKGRSFNIIIVSPRVSHMLETMVFFLTRVNEYKVKVITEDLDASRDQGPDHAHSLPRLMGLKNIEVKNFDFQLKENSDLVLLNPINLPNAIALHWIAKASKFGLITSYFDSNRFLLQQCIKLNTLLLRSDCVIIETSNKVNWPYWLIRKKYFSTPHIHPQLMLDDRYNSIPHDEKVEKRFMFSFVGNIQPVERESILKIVLDHFSKDPDYRVVNELHPFEVNKKLILWRVYGANTGGTAFQPLDYTYGLKASVFSLCPTGWGRWTHRLIESIYFGAIPILEDPEIYNIGLKHRVNCIVAEKGNWVEAVRLANALPQEDVLLIQSNLKRVKAELVFDQVAKRIKSFVDSVIE